MVDKEREKMKGKEHTDLKDLSILLSQHSDVEEDEDDSNLDDESHYKSVMAKPLFNTDEDQDDEDLDDDEAGRKGVHWGADVADHHREAVRGQKTVKFGSNDANTGIVALNMRQTKIGFDQEDYKQIYKG